MADNDFLPPNPEEPGILPDFSANPAPTPQPEDNQNQSQPNPLQDKLNELKKQKVEETKARLKNGFQKLTKRSPVEGPGGTPKNSGQTSQPTAQAGRRITAEGAKKATQAAAQATKQVAKQTSKAVAKFVAANPEVWIPIAIILVVFILIAIIIGIFAFSRGAGSALPSHPTTAAQRQQVTKLSALSGSQIANTQLLQQTISAEKNRLASAKAVIAKAYASDSGKISAATTELTAIINGLDDITNPVKAPDVTARQKLIQNTESALQKFATNYPEVLGYGAVRGAYLKVPGVGEAAQGDCGAASVLMVTLYYNPAYADGEILDRTAHRSTRGGSVCVSTEYLNAHTPHSDWVRGEKGKATIENIKRSLAGGDPVIIYGARGAIFSNSKHIFVIVGYDQADDTFLVNNPNIGSGNVQVHTKTPNGHQMTSTNLAAHLGNSAPDPVGYGHNYVMMIRSKYL